MDFDLERFVNAQDAGDSYRAALQEMADGEKVSHWMWYVFPQMRGLGRSGMAVRYGISSLYEAYAYMNHHELRTRLCNAVQTLTDYNFGRDIDHVMGHIDAMKLKSCLTLFDVVEPESVFDRALEYFFDGERDEKTLTLIARDRAVIDENVWKKFGVPFCERAFFDSGCHEAANLTPDVSRATFLDLVKRGYSVVTLAWQYLVRHDDLFDGYRTVNTETTLTSAGFNTLLELYDILDKRIDPTPITQLSALFPLVFFEYDESMTWERAAYRLDALFRFMLDNPVLSGISGKWIAEHSLLPQE